MTSSPLTFSIIAVNLFQTDKNGNGSVTVTNSTLPISPLTLPGGPATLADLITMVGSQNISITYSLSANGKVSGHDCKAIFDLYADLTTSDNVTTPKLKVAATPQQGYNGYISITQQWLVAVTNTTKLVTKVTADGDCDNGTGGGCGCSFQDQGGWNEAYISLKADVSVNLLNWCTTANTSNIEQPMCYDYLTSYATANGTTKQISDFLNTYCAKKYANSNLNIFNSQGDFSEATQDDYQYCACFMPTPQYLTMYTSLQSDYPKMDIGTSPYSCLMPACYNSVFKNLNSTTCTLPGQCLATLQVTPLNTVTSQTLNTSVDCSTYGIVAPPPKQPAVAPVLTPSEQKALDAKNAWPAQKALYAPQVADYLSNRPTDSPSFAPQISNYKSEWADAKTTWAPQVKAKKASWPAGQAPITKKSAYGDFKKYQQGAPPAVVAPTNNDTLKKVLLWGSVALGVIIVLALIIIGVFLIIKAKKAKAMRNQELA